MPVDRTLGALLHDAAIALACIFCLTLVAMPAAAQTGKFSKVEAAKLAGQVKREFLHAWTNYETYAWGHDELRPLSRTAKDWYGQPLLMTPVDALDTLIIMHLDGEANKARKLIDTKLSFDRDISVKNFEITIRLLGGLLSSYEMSNDPRLLELAHDLGDRLLPVFASPTGLPYVNVNLRTGAVSGTDTNPAETGSLILEFCTLSRLTGNPVYCAKAKRALVETFRRRSPIGLVGDGLDAATGKWTSPDSHVSGGIDSYLEYQWKCWKLLGDRDCLDMWKASIAAVNKYDADERGGELWYGHVDMNTGRRTATEWGALDAFFPGLLAFSGDIARARRLQDSSFEMWNVTGVEPEIYNYATGKIEDPHYELRPEIVESTYYLWRLTGDPKYRRMGAKMFADFVAACRVPYGYAALDDVVTKQKADRMESFAFAETFKYFYLLFAPRTALDFDRVVFNTEAHPLKRLAPQ
ncbi:MAG: glycoside hydrolase family 47 protein [Alphaproteobacteria bacterium]|nr:glycoside hydrolase family 47 protein [Alphaproteobacteria bacterium]